MRGKGVRAWFSVPPPPVFESTPLLADRAGRGGDGSAVGMGEDEAVGMDGRKRRGEEPQRSKFLEVEVSLIP